MLQTLTRDDAFAGNRSAHTTVAPQRPAPASDTDSPARFEVGWARHLDEVREAQRLRWRVFVDEMGARPAIDPDAPPFHDIDRFDPWCEHLLVRVAGGTHAGLLIGTYRVLTPDAARRAGGFYSETEFDLSPVRELCARAVELGRSCVHPQWRTGGAILALWGALGEFMLRHRLDTMIGCASIGMNDGGHHAASLWRQLRATHLVAPPWQVQPHVALPTSGLRDDLEVDTPALIKGYLRCGAKVLGAPAWDCDFNTADLPMMMRIEQLPARYRRHFLDGQKP
jgi:putative hemolysin